MATYFHGAPEIQSDGLQTLYLMNPGYAGYSADVTPGPTSMVFLNSAANSIGSTAILQSQAQQNHHQQQQHYFGIPLQQPHVAAAAPDVLSAGLLPRAQYNLWNQNPVSNSVDLTSQLGLRRPAAIASSQQGLSLSLSPQQASCYNGYRSEAQFPGATQPPVISPIGIGGGEDVRFSGGSPSTASGASNGVPGLQGLLLGSKYLKVAQQLLDEVVHVGKGTKEDLFPKAKGQVKVNKEGEDGNSNDGETSSTKKAAELSTTERQEFQMKKAKLVNMLDEVEQRYRQYHHQMQIVISTFETVAGPGSARTYTALALQTISRQFRCLRDAITGQIRAASRSLGEEDNLLGSKSEGGGSRLRFVDHHLRQQRALQQLGMMQHNAWRPQRGLPERSVSILRAWLFEHFLHPYPKDSDKHMLAKQTGLTRNQVSNWFINARVRLWKPMVEEMYMEETKNQENQNNNANADKASKSSDANEDSSASKSSAPPINSPTGTEQSLATPRPLQGAHLTHPHQSGTSRVVQTSYADDEIMMNNPKLKRARSNESLSQNQMLHTIPMNMELKPDEASNTDFFIRFGNGRQPVEDHGGYSSFLSAASASNGNGFGAYSIGEIGRFDAGQFAQSYSGNGVSLTLGLPHCESLSLSGAQPSFLAADSIPLGRRLELSTDQANDYCGGLNNNSNSTAQVSPSPNGYEYDNLTTIQSRKRFAAQLLHDFVA